MQLFLNKSVSEFGGGSFNKPAFNFNYCYLINLCIRAKIQQAKVATRIQVTHLRQEKRKFVEFALIA